MPDLPVVVVGGGIVGLAVAREVVRRQPGREVVVLEKEERLASHQTGHNSGVVHAGIYYAPGSLKAQLCTAGRIRLREHCQDRGLPYVECGKLVVALDRDEVGRLDELERRSRENGVPRLRRVDGAGITEVEPHAQGVSALHSPVTSITDYVAIAESFADDVRGAGGRIELGAPVVGLTRQGGAVDVATPTGVERAGTVIVCGGLQSDRLAAMAGAPDAPAIVPFRGQYVRISEAKQDLVNGMIYPVPDPRYPFLGVHYTRLVDGGLEVGPNAILALAREGYDHVAATVAADVRDTVTWPGFWQLAREHWRAGVRELPGALSVRAYMRAARRYVPSIGADDVEGTRSGIRAQAVDRDGGLVDDFVIHEEDGIVCLRNAPSPAATASLAIADHVLERIRL